MKKILFLILLISGFSSCKKYLNLTPVDTVVSSTFYANEAQLTSALMAVYSPLGNTDESTYSRFLSLEAPAANDEDYYSGGNASASNYNQSASFANFYNCWTNMYAGIERANLLLENIDKADAPQTSKDYIRGEALFLRAYYHFVLVSYWGDVPLKLSSTKSVTEVSNPRTPAKDIYAQIVKDMTTAEGLVKPITFWNNTGRVSKTAVEGILARVCLYAAGRLHDPSYYPQSLSWSQKVITSGLHSLNPDYKQIFINETADLYDIKESLWEVEFYRDAAGQYSEYERFGSTIGINNSNINLGFMQGGYGATGNHYALYAAGDTRRDWNMSNFYYTGNNASNAKVYFPTTYTWGRYVAKWRREYQPASIITVKNFGGANWPLLRYSDVLLMNAEADNEINGPTAAAISKVNAIRERAYNGVKTITVTNGGSGYTSAPTVTINSTSGSGTIATANRSSANVITSVTITYTGSGYTSAPTVSFTGGGGTGAAATAALYSPTDADLLPAQTSSQSVFRQTIMDERSRELAFEGHRKLDLLRWGILVSTMQNMVTIINAQAPSASNSTFGYAGRTKFLVPYTNFTARDTLFAIPTVELSLNPAMTQNPGW
jgi:hypothetical protein